MTAWSEEDLRELGTILGKIEEDLAPLPGKEILVLCCGAGEVAFRLAGKMAGRGRVVGLDLSDTLLEQAERRAQEEGLSDVLQFQKAEMYRLPFPDESFDALVSEFIVYPAAQITQIGQQEMARVLRPRGLMVLTDVITTTPLTEDLQRALRVVGLDYMCEATVDDFDEWMADAGLKDVTVTDFTLLLRSVWKRRRVRDPVPERRPAYAILLNTSRIGLGETFFYIYIRGEK